MFTDVRLDNTRCFEHLGAPEDWDDNIICSLFTLSVNDETDNAASTLSIIPNNTIGKMGYEANPFVDPFERVINFLLSFLIELNRPLNNSSFEE